MRCGAVQCSALRVAGESRGQATATGCGQQEEERFGGGEDKGLAWVFSFFPRQYVLISCGEE